MQTQPQSQVTRRVTTNAEVWVENVRKDLFRTQDYILGWTKGTATQRMAYFDAYYGKRKYIAVVDGSTSKPVEQAHHRVVVTYITSVIAKSAERARNVLMNIINERTTQRSGKLYGGWNWWHQTGKKGALTVRFLGSSIPADLMLRYGDALVLTTTAPYAQAVNRNLMKPSKVTFISTARRKKGTKAQTVQATGFMLAARKAVERDLKRAGLKVKVSFSWATPPGPSGIGKYKKWKQGSPMLVFIMMKNYVPANTTMQ